MSSFTKPLEVKQLPDGKWETLRGFAYHVGGVPSTTVYTVPEGFKTDFASIPRFFWTLIGHPAGRYSQAAVLHDFLYRFTVCSRSMADGIFLEAMAVLGVPRWQRWTMWAGVRIGGGNHYGRATA